MAESTLPQQVAPDDLEAHRRSLTAYCYRMLGSAFEAEDAAQEALLRAWRSADRFEGRAALRSWLFRIATNVCLDMVRSSQRRARPIDLGPAGEPIEANLHIPVEARWIEPIPDSMLDDDPADITIRRESVRLALVAALQRLPGRQRAALILHDVLRWEAREVAELLETSVAAVNSGLQRARATLGKSRPGWDESPPPVGAVDRAVLERYVAAFERYDLDALTALIREDATQSMPPYDLWLRGRRDIFAWWLGPGIGCRGSRLLPTVGANGCPAFGQYKPGPNGGYEPWALHVVEASDGRIADLTFFLDTEHLFPLFALPPRLNRQ